MDLLSLIKHRRSIRKYTEQQISIEDLQYILDAGLYAPNAGGGQRSMLVAVHNPEEVERLGRLNVASTLRDLEADGLVSRKAFSEIPPRVEYALTDRARTLLPIIQQLVGWAIENKPAIITDRTLYMQAHRE